MEPQAEGTAADLADPYLDEGTGRVVELGTAEVARKGKEMAVGGGVGGVGVEAHGATVGEPINTKGGFRALPPDEPRLSAPPPARCLEFDLTKLRLESDDIVQWSLGGRRTGPRPTLAVASLEGGA